LKIHSAVIELLHVDGSIDMAKLIGTLSRISIANMSRCQKEYRGGSKEYDINQLYCRRFCASARNKNSNEETVEGARRMANGIDSKLKNTSLLMALRISNQ
jgi:hypothetical protein